MMTFIFKVMMILILKVMMMILIFKLKFEISSASRSEPAGNLDIFCCLCDNSAMAINQPQ